MCTYMLLKESYWSCELGGVGDCPLPSPPPPSSPHCVASSIEINAVVFKENYHHKVSMMPIVLIIPKCLKRPDYWYWSKVHRHTAIDRDPKANWEVLCFFYSGKYHFTVVSCPEGKPQTSQAHLSIYAGRMKDFCSWCLHKCPAFLFTAELRLGIVVTQSSTSCSSGHC